MQLRLETILESSVAGSKAAQRLAAEGFQVTAWNRNAAKAEALVELGLDFKAAQHEAVEECDVAVLFLADAEAIESILFSNSKALEALRGKTVLQMGTIGESIPPSPLNLARARCENPLEATR